MCPIRIENEGNGSRLVVRPGQTKDVGIGQDMLMTVIGKKPEKGGINAGSVMWIGPEGRNLLPPEFFGLAIRPEAVEMNVGDTFTIQGLKFTGVR